MIISDEEFIILVKSTIFFSDISSSVNDNKKFIISSKGDIFTMFLLLNIWFFFSEIDEINLSLLKHVYNFNLIILTKHSLSNKFCK